MAPSGTPAGSPADPPAPGEPRLPAPADPARRLVRNIARPFAAQLVGKVLGLGYLVVQVKLLARGELGQYAFATVVWLYLSIIAEWGLGTWLTREVAAHRTDQDTGSAAPLLFARTLGLRLRLAGLALVTALSSC